MNRIYLLPFICSRPINDVSREKYAIECILCASCACFVSKRLPFLFGSVKYSHTVPFLRRAGKEINAKIKRHKSVNHLRACIIEK